MFYGKVGQFCMEIEMNFLWEEMRFFFYGNSGQICGGKNVLILYGKNGYIFYEKNSQIFYRKNGKFLMEKNVKLYKENMFNFLWKKW